MIVAVDFDGILCRDEFPQIGEPNYGVVSLVREIIDAGHEVVLWTGRADDRLVEAVRWCEDRGLHFCAVNENAPSNRARYEGEYPNGTRKVYADAYLDDKSVEFRSLADGDRTWGGKKGYQVALERLVASTRKVVLDD